MSRLTIVGVQWGDEGKGKMTDYLAQKSDVVVRYQGGNNAGHTVVSGDKKLALPEPAKGEQCVIKPIGGLRDGQLLMQVGKRGYVSDETGALVVAVSPDSGKIGWKTQGTYVATVPPLGGGSSGARLMLGQGGTYNYDLVVSSVTSR